MHYWAIHAKVTEREWRRLDTRIRDVIAADFEHTTREYRSFESFVNSETERLFGDCDYYFNNPTTFRAPIPSENPFRSPRPKRTKS